MYINLKILKMKDITLQLPILILLLILDILLKQQYAIIIC